MTMTTPDLIPRCTSCGHEILPAKAITRPRMACLVCSVAPDSPSRSGPGSLSP